MFKMIINLPYYGELRVKELTNKEIFAILKYCTAGDLQGLEEFLTESIFSHLPPLNIIDKFYMLLFLRAFYLGETIQIKIKHDKVPHMDFFLQTMLENIETAKRVEPKTIELEGFKVILDIPSKLFYNTTEDMVFDCVKEIQIGEDTYNLSNISSDLKDRVLKALPSKLAPKIYNFFHDAHNTIGDVVMISEYPNYEIEKVSVKPISNDPLAYIMSIFSQNLTDYLGFMYHYVNKVGGTFKDFMDLTFNDAKIILDFHQEEMIKQNESLNTKKGTTI